MLIILPLTVLLVLFLRQEGRVVCFNKWMDEKKVSLSLSSLSPSTPFTRTVEQNGSCCCIILDYNEVCHFLHENMRDKTCTLISLFAHTSNDDAAAGGPPCPKVKILATWIPERSCWEGKRKKSLILLLHNCFYCIILLFPKVFTLLYKKPSVTNTDK